VGFQDEVDVDHAELVGVAASGSGGMLAGGEVSALFGLQDDLAGPLS
jgi:hypothetical protein